jgi:hypothetical protein
MVGTWRHYDALWCSGLKSLVMSSQHALSTERENFNLRVKDEGLEM